MGIDSANVNNDKSAELNHASENYDELLRFIKPLSAKNSHISLLELASYKTRDTNADKDLFLDFVGL
ncbi:hypothetical protein HpMS150_08100 [Helicobacter pylori]